MALNQKLPAIEQLPTIVTYDDKDNVLRNAFGLPLVDWTVQDLEIFKGALLDCRARNPKSFPTPNYYNGQDGAYRSAVLSAVSSLKSTRDSLLKLKERNDDVERLRQRYLAIATRPDELATEKEVQELADISSTISQITGNSSHYDLKDQIFNAMERKKRVLRAKEDQARHEAERLRMEDEQAQNRAQYARVEADRVVVASRLLAKYGDLGPSEDFLSSSFSLDDASFQNFGVASYGPIILLHDRLAGEKSWELDQDVWVLSQSFRSPGAPAGHLVKYVFVEENGRIPVLQSIYWDGSELGQQQKVDIMLKLMGLPQALIMQ